MPLQRIHGSLKIASDGAAPMARLRWPNVKHQISCGLHIGASGAQCSVPRRILPPDSQRRSWGSWLPQTSRARSGIQLTSVAQNRELVVSDTLLLVVFSLYKQLAAIILLPSFPGWLVPLEFNPMRLVEFFVFAGTLTGSWVAVGLLVGGYQTDATADLPTALARTCLVWTLSMPVAAAQLVLLTAAEDGVLVGADGFARVLPLAASGPGEPFVTAAGVLGLMAVWRAFYATFLDFFSFLSASGGRLNRRDDIQHFGDALRAALLLSLAGCVLLQVLGQGVGEERLEGVALSTLTALQTLGN